MVERTLSWVGFRMSSLRNEERVRPEAEPHPWDPVLAP